MFVFFKRHRVWPNKTSLMLKSSMRTNPLNSNLEDMNHGAHRLDWLIQ